MHPSQRASAPAGNILGMPETQEGHPVFARFYDRLFASSERAGLEQLRASLLAHAAGNTLEIGAGTGLNLPHYPGEVDSLVLAEPDPHMASQLRERLEQEGSPARNVSVIEAGAEELPFDDGTFDTVVSTLVLCTVPDPDAGIAEVRRVLAPSGAFLFMEHVRGDSHRLTWWQDRLERPWGWFAGGCHPNRPTAASIADAGFHVEQLEQTEFPKAPPIVRPLIRGIARRP
jgi:ubiquinone/menaquinone biosynthesis C-methylase UbiE